MSSSFLIFSFQMKGYWVIIFKQFQEGKNLSMTKKKNDLLPKNETLQNVNKSGLNDFNKELFIS